MANQQQTDLPVYTTTPDSPVEATATTGTTVSFPSVMAEVPVNNGSTPVEPVSGTIDLSAQVENGTGSLSGFQDLAGNNNGADSLTITPLFGSSGQVLESSNDWRDLPVSRASLETIPCVSELGQLVGANAVADINSIDEKEKQCYLKIQEEAIDHFTASPTNATAQGIINILSGANQDATLGDTIAATALFSQAMPGFQNFQHDKPYPSIYADLADFDNQVNQSLTEAVEVNLDRDRISALLENNDVRNLLDRNGGRLTKSQLERELEGETDSTKRDTLQYMIDKFDQLSWDTDEEEPAITEETLKDAVSDCDDKINLKEDARATTAFVQSLARGDRTEPFAHPSDPLQDIVAGAINEGRDGGMCIGFAILASMVHNGRQREIKDMIEPAEGGHNIKLPGEEESVFVPTQTAKDVPFTGTGLEHGNWASLISTGMYRAQRCSPNSTQCSDLENAIPSETQRVESVFGRRNLVNLIETATGREAELTRIIRGEFQSDVMKAKIDEALASNRVVVAATTGMVVHDKLENGHAYAVVGTEGDNIVLFNPFGQNSEDGAYVKIRMKDLRLNFGAIAFEKA